MIPYKLNGEDVFLAVDGNGRATLALHFKNFIKKLSYLGPQDLLERVASGRIYKSLVDENGCWTYENLELEMYVISIEHFLSLDKPKLFRVLTFINMDTRATTSGMSGYLYDIMNYVTSKILAQPGKREPCKVCNLYDSFWFCCLFVFWVHLNT